MFLRSIEETITISRKEYYNLKRENAELKQQLSEVQSMIRDLQIEIQFLKNGRKSDTSSTPSSQDYGRSNKYGTLCGVGHFEHHTFKPIICLITARMLQFTTFCPMTYDTLLTPGIVYLSFFNNLIQKPKVVLH